MEKLIRLGGPLFAPLYWGTDLVSMMLALLGHPVNRVVAWFNGKASNVFCGAKSAAKKMIICVVLFVVILWASVLLYASFYHMYVPTATIVRPAHFKFRVCPSGAGMCTFPMANVTLGAENKAEVLGRGQQYLVILEMLLPDSLANRDVGMFMVMIRMYDRYGVTTQESSRAVSLKYQSDLLKTIQTLLLSPLYITGFAEEIQTLKIDLFGNFWDDYYRPSVGALLEVHSRQLMFYSAHVQFHATYGGLRYYLFYYPISCAVLGILFNCLWLAPALLIPWYTYGLNLLNGHSASSNNNSSSSPSRRSSAGGEGRMEPWTGDVSSSSGSGGGGGDRRRGSLGRQVEFATELDVEEKDVETVSRYSVQPFTMMTLPSPPSPSSPSHLGSAGVQTSASTQTTRSHDDTRPETAPLTNSLL